MCGIAGWIGHIEKREQVAEAMKNAMLHRGPDAQQYRHWENVTFIHNRLNIIDLSELGTQPMCNEDGSVWIVFNGEIYNHHVLRKELLQKGHLFRSKTDTEAIIHLYEELGDACIGRLRGMFALAIFDLRKQKVLLARDRFGIKPLFYYHKNGLLAFASEINTLKQIPGADLIPDEQSIFDFTALFQIPAPRTFYKHIRALKPGEMAWVDVNPEVNSLQISPFYQLRIQPDMNLRPAEAIEKTKHLMELSVKSQMESDVPLGALLSGGIDSSLVSYYAQKNIQQKLNTFNVKFPDTTADETWAAVMVAEHIHSRHQTLSIEEGTGTWEHITQMLLHAGQPFADTSYFAMHGVSKIMKQHVTVALSGDGGDEAFGGYPIFQEIEKVSAFNRLPKAITWPLVQALHLAAGSSERIARYSRALRNFYGKDDLQVLQNFFLWIRPAEHEQLLRSSAGMAPMLRYFENDFRAVQELKLQPLETLSAASTLINTNILLANDFLFKVDTASMKESLEVRVPLLDEELFEFGFSLPHILKYNKKELKHVLRSIARDVLPDQVANKPKWGFSIPVDVWVEADFKEKAARYLLHKESPLQQYLNPAVYEPWVKLFCYNQQSSGISRESLYQRLIMLLALCLHLDNNKLYTRMNG